jgi:hypothetical protein
MSGPSTMPPGPPPPPGAYGYPPAGPGTPTVPVSERFTPESLAARGPWSFLAFLAQAVGLVLVFVGTLVVVVAGAFPADCLGGCTVTTGQGVLYGLETARILWTLGLFGIAGGAGIRLQFQVPNPLPTTPEATRIYLARRRGEFAILVIALLLLFVILLTAAFSVAGLPI